MRWLLAGALLLVAGPAWAFCPSPNPNLLGPGHFVDNCPLPAAGLNLGAATTAPAFIGPVSITTPVGSQNRGLDITLTPTGSSSATEWYNHILVTDSVAVGVLARSAFVVEENFGGVTGGASAIGGFLKLTSSTGASNPNANYPAGYFRSTAQTSDGGVPGTPHGAFFGLGGGAFACGTAIEPGFCVGTAATNLLEVAGGEINAQMAQGSSAKYKAGWSIVATPSDAVQGSTWDCQLCLSNQTGAVGWRDLILIGPMNGVHPSDTGGTLLRSISGIYANGIDLSTDTISGKAWKSPGITVSGLGVIVNTGMPTSCSGQATGTLWNNAGTVKVC